MTADMQTSIRASRRRVARSRGALSGILLMILGLWAAIAPFVGPSLNIAYTPSPNADWHWTAARGWLEVLPGVATFLGGLLLLVSASRLMTVLGGWLAALGGAWLVIGPALAPAINVHAGQPDPTAGVNNRALTALLFFYAVGAAILFFASLALGRVSVLSVRDVRAAERRAEVEEAQRQAALEAAAAEQRERAAAEQRERAVAEQRAAAEQRDGGAVQRERVQADDAAGRHAAGADQAPITDREYAHHGPAAPSGNGQYSGQYPPGQYPTGHYPPGQYPSAPPPPNES